MAWIPRKRKFGTAEGRYGARIEYLDTPRLNQVEKDTVNNFLSLYLSRLCVLERSHAAPGFARFRASYAQHDWTKSGLKGNSGLYTTDPRKRFVYP